MTDTVQIKFDTSRLVELAKKFHSAKKNFPAALAKAINQVGDDTVKAMQAVLPAQTGLPRSTFRRAIKGQPGTGTYTIRSHGGDIRLKFFSPKETASGVVAHPWNANKLYPGTFMKSGWWPNRKGWVKGPNVVLRRVGAAKYPLKGVRSGLFIPTEMVTGQSEATFYAAVEIELAKKVEVELFRVLA